MSSLSKVPAGSSYSHLLITGLYCLSNITLLFKIGMITTEPLCSIFSMIFSFPLGRITLSKYTLNFLPLYFPYVLNPV
jgi:hypothetical protein